MKKSIDQVFSINLEKFRKYKPEVDFETRILFELMLSGYFRIDHENGEFQIPVDEVQIQRQFGIKPSNTAKIVRWFSSKGFIAEIIEQIREQDEIIQSTYVDFNRHTILDAAKELMRDSTLFEKEFEALLIEKDSEAESE